MASTEIRLDVVLDEAEIPTFQERQRLDTNGDGAVSASEIEAERQTHCQHRLADIHLSVDATPVVLQITASGISLPLD